MSYRYDLNLPSWKKEVIGEEVAERKKLPSGKNTNHLQCVICPQCGHEDGFYISGYASIYVSDDTVDTDQGEWDFDSFCRCPECGHESEYGDFWVDHKIIKKAVESKVNKIRLPDPEEEKLVY